MAAYHQEPPMQNYAQGTNVTQQEWSNGLCDCGPIGTCCMGTWLPCVLLGKTSERIRDPSMQTYSSVNSDCMILCGIQCITGCGWM